MQLISANDLGVSFRGTRVLWDVDLSVNTGEIVTIVGPNGSGKTTLLRALIGAERLSAGSLVRSPKLRIGYVPQSLHLDSTLPMTVARFMRLPRSSKDEAEALHRVGAAALLAKQMTSLSGGQLRRVLLARAILGRPQLLILDEPTTGLDQPGSAAFYELIEQIRSELGCGILMVSHELNVVMRASDRVICLNGHVCCHGTPEVVASDPEYLALFGAQAHGALAVYRHHHDHDHDHDHPPHEHSH